MFGSSIVELEAQCFNCFLFPPFIETKQRKKGFTSLDLQKSCKEKGEREECDVSDAEIDEEEAEPEADEDEEDEPEIES